MSWIYEYMIGYFSSQLANTIKLIDVFFTLLSCVSLSLYDACSDQAFLPVHMHATTEVKKKMSPAQSDESDPWRNDYKILTAETIQNS